MGVFRQANFSVKLVCQEMRPTRLVIALVVVVVVVIMAVVAPAPRRAPLARQSQTAAMALLEFQAQWTTNGNDIVWSRSRWPTSIKALGMNGVEVGGTLARASKREEGPSGIWWSQGYQIQRQRTDDNHWTLYRTRAVGLPNHKGLTWRNRLAIVTNAPGGLTNRSSQ